MPISLWDVVGTVVGAVLERPFITINTNFIQQKEKLMKQWMMIVIMVLLVACQQQADVTAQADKDSQIVVEDAPPIVFTNKTEQANGKMDTVREMMNCMAHEPTSLALYGYVGADKLSSEGRSASMLQVLLYERLVVQRSGEYEARGVEALPNFADGTAVWQTITVQAGDMVADANGDVVVLQNGVTVETAVGETITFVGEPIQMKQLVAQFTLKPFVWSDGVPVTAADSVRSYEMAMRLGDSKQEVTANYEVVDSLTVQWTGVAGWYDDRFVTYVWQPIPSQDDGLAAHAPLSYGPFVVAGWDAGERIVLEKNPYYPFTHSSEVDRMVYEFIDIQEG